MLALRFTLLVGATVLLSAPAALAQRFMFERTLTAGSAPRLDISTKRGRIAITAGDAAHVVIKGTVTVRTGFDVPANAVELARALAAKPEIDQQGDLVRLRPPADSATDRAVTVSYEIQIPPGASITSDSDSGATEIAGINGPVIVSTSSAAITLRSLGGKTSVKTGSGAVEMDSVAGPLEVTSQSGGLEMRGLRGSLHAKTQSGNLAAAFTAAADVSVETRSSAITLNGVEGAIDAHTQGGRVIVQGTPTRPWTVTTGSSAIELSIPSSMSFSIDARSGSGSVVVEGFHVEGTNEKRQVGGKVSNGGPLVTLESKSGAIKIRAASAKPARNPAP